MEKHHRDAGMFQLFIEVQIGGWQGGFGPLDDKTAYRLVEQVLEDGPLIGHPVLSGENQRGVPIRGEDRLDILQDRRIYSH